jgi:type III secretion system chaperone SycN
MAFQEIVQEFSQRVGIGTGAGRFQTDASGPVTFELPELGKLTLEPSADERELLITLAVPLPPYDTGRLLAALEMCHPDRVRPFPLACGVYKEALLLVSRRKIDGSSAAEVENQVIFLIDCVKTLNAQGR